ncbi:hypothetical protein Tco_0740548 [Tanacetum coccineum]
MIQTSLWKNTSDLKKKRLEDKDHSFTNLETEYPAIVFDDTSDATLSCEPTVSPNEIDFNISFDESDDEDYIVIFDENSFSCKIISVDNLKTDSEDENDKVNMPSSLSPEPTFGYIDNLDFFKDFENEFPAIAYNDLKSKSDPLIEPSVNMALPPQAQRYQYLRYEGLQYTDADIADFEARLTRIYRREVHRVHVFDFRRLPDLIAERLSTRMLVEHRDAQGQSVFTSRAWRRLFDIRGPLVHKLILEFFSTFRFGEAVLDLDTPGALQF